MVDSIKTGYGNYNVNGELSFKQGSPKVEEEKLSQAEIRAKKRSGEMECTRCENRKYVDGSDDAGVSFKTPQHISPSQSQAAVTGHELEHYNRETASAKMENKEVVSASITLSRAVCPECGRSYVSGGQTSVTKRTDVDKLKEQEHFRNKFYQNTLGKYAAGKVDKKI